MSQFWPVKLQNPQIRYRIRYLTWMRLHAWATSHGTTYSRACDTLLAEALTAHGVPTDPADLLATELGNA